MGGSQGSVPTWVPILVGVLGMLGVIAGQLINAWREDRRWKREQEREEVRHARELAKDKQQQEHDKSISWLEKRLEIYTEALSAAKKHRQSLRRLHASKKTEEGWSTSRDFIDWMLSEREQLIASLQAAFLVANPETHKALTSIPKAFFDDATSIAEKIDSGDRHTIRFSEDIRTTPKMNEAIGGATRSIRRDLGVHSAENSLVHEFPE